MRIIDMHCDTLLECYIKNERLRKNGLSIDLEKLKKNNTLVQFFAMFLPTGQAAREENIQLKPFDFFCELSHLYCWEMEKNSDLIKQALSYDDIIDNDKNNIISSILTVEDGQLLEEDLNRLDFLYQKGVRLITLTWNSENCIGFPNHPDPDLNQKGLKPFGLDVVKRMEELGMIVDVSHLSEGGFYDVAKHSSKPFIASHSCAKTLCDHTRNLTDDQLMCIAEKGGVVGVNFNAPFLRENATVTRTEDIVEHVRYMVSVMGAEHVALGSDFDGMDCKLEIPNYDYYGEVVAALEKEFSEEIVEKICYKNVLQLLKECL